MFSFHFIRLSLYLKVCGNENCHQYIQYSSFSLNMEGEMRRNLFAFRFMYSDFLFALRLILRLLLSRTHSGNRFVNRLTHNACRYLALNELRIIVRRCFERLSRRFIRCRSRRRSGVVLWLVRILRFDARVGAETEPIFGIPFEIVYGVAYLWWEKIYNQITILLTRQWFIAYPPSRLNCYPQTKDKISHGI